MDYQDAYFSLFAAMADAIDAIEQQNFGTSKEILVRAQQKWEECYLEE